MIEIFLESVIKPLALAPRVRKLEDQLITEIEWHKIRRNIWSWSYGTLQVWEMSCSQVADFSQVQKGNIQSFSFTIENVYSGIDRISGCQVQQVAKVPFPWNFTHWHKTWRPRHGRGQNNRETLTLAFEMDVGFYRESEWASSFCLSNDSFFKRNHLTVES